MNTWAIRGRSAGSTASFSTIEAIVRMSRSLHCSLSLMLRGVARVLARRSSFQTSWWRWISRSSTDVGFSSTRNW